MEVVQLASSEEEWVRASLVACGYRYDASWVGQPHLGSCTHSRYYAARRFGS